MWNLAKKRYDDHVIEMSNRCKRRTQRYEEGLKEIAHNHDIKVEIAEEIIEEHRQLRCELESI